MKIAIFITSLLGLVSLVAAVWTGFSEFEENSTTAKICASIKGFLTKTFKWEFCSSLLAQRFIISRIALGLVLIFGLVSIILTLAK
jgi:hypothetical protein